MKVRFHPVFDNPVRMGYVQGWTTIKDLVERLGDLEQAVGEGRIVPARWECYLPVNGRSHALTRQILRLDHSKVVLLRARKSARAVPWEKVTLVHLFAEM